MTLSIDDLTYRDVAKTIDHSLLRPELDDAFVEAGCRLAAEYDVASVCVRPADVARAAALLAGTDVAVGTTIGFPHGNHRTETKVFESVRAIGDGATELDMVIQIGALKSGRDADVQADIAAVVGVAHAARAIVKVIFENAYLTDDEKIRACHLTEAAGADFVKTSTGFAPSGATHEDLILMRANTSPHIGVKAAGGVRTLDALLEVMALGVTRVGATATSDDARRLPRAQGRRPSPVGPGARVRARRTAATDAGRPMTGSRPPLAAGPRRWLSAATRSSSALADTQAETIETASQWCADAIAGDGLVHLFGTGHSRIPVEEMFPRYGSYPGFNPLVELSMTFHTQVVGANGQRQAMFIERTPGLAEVILSNFTFGPHDVLMVFSASGLSAVPVEMARGGRRRGLRVIAVTSVAQSMSGQPDPIVRARLLDEADLVIDLCTPHADALCAIDGLDTPVGPGSTIAAVAIVNCIKVRTAELLLERGALPPILTRASVVGADRSRESFDDAYREHARRIATAITREG